MPQFTAKYRADGSIMIVVAKDDPELSRCVVGGVENQKDKSVCVCVCVFGCRSGLVCSEPLSSLIHAAKHTRG